jgi:hypothetical protein
MKPRGCSEALCAASPYQSVMTPIRRLVEERTDQPASPLSGKSAAPGTVLQCRVVTATQFECQYYGKIGIGAHRCSCWFYASVTASRGESSAAASSRSNMRGFPRNCLFPSGGRSRCVSPLWAHAYPNSTRRCRALDLGATERVCRDRSIFGEPLRERRQSAPDSGGGGSVVWHLCVHGECRSWSPGDHVAPDTLSAGGRQADRTLRVQGQFWSPGLGDIFRQPHRGKRPRRSDRCTQGWLVELHGRCDGHTRINDRPNDVRHLTASRPVLLARVDGGSVKKPVVGNAPRPAQRWRHLANCRPAAL